jgi:hypothetical protein
MQWSDSDDDEDDDDHDNITVKTVDHAWFWMTLQNFLDECISLKTFDFKGSPIPLEIDRKFRSSRPRTQMSFVKATSTIIRPSSSSSLPHTNIVVQQSPPPFPQIPPPPPQNLSPFGNYPTFNEAITFNPLNQIHRQTSLWPPILEPYPETTSLPQQLPPFESHSIFDFQLPIPTTMSSSQSSNLPGIYENFPLNSMNPSIWQPYEQAQTYIEPSFFDVTDNFRQGQGIPTFEEEQEQLMNMGEEQITVQQDWDWYVHYDK